MQSFLSGEMYATFFCVLWKYFFLLSSLRHPLGLVGIPFRPDAIKPNFAIMWGETYVLIWGSVDLRLSHQQL